jgi:hypothetical protein
MNILIVGKSGVGKSNLGDIVKNTIFKLDSNAKIESDDPDRAVKSFGKGNNVYNIRVKKLWEGQDVGKYMDSIFLESGSETQDVIIVINNKKFMEWFRTVYNKAGVG